VIALSATALVAVAVALSAVFDVSREPVGPTGAVVPTIPLTTTPPPPAQETTDFLGPPGTNQ
jgi:hypothetical protein